jgi:streptogramin lyase
MPSLFACPTCNASLTLDDPNAEIIRCKYCGATVVVPDDVKPDKPQPLAQPQAQAWTINPSPQVMIQVDYGDSAFVPTGRRRGSTFWTCFGVLIFLIVLAASVIPILVTKYAISGIFGSIAPGMSTAMSGINGVSATRTNPSARNSTRTPTPRGGLVSTSTPIGVANVPTANPFGAVLTFGGKGTGAGLFDDARDIGVDAEGNIYVSDYINGYIHRFNADGKFQSNWMTEKQPGPLLAMAVDRGGNVYGVRGGSIYKFEGKTGKQLRKIATSGISYRDVVVLNDGNLLAFGNSGASDDLVRLDADGRVLRRFNKVVSTQTERSETLLKVAVDGLGTMFAVSNYSYAVFKFTPEGKYDTRFGSLGDSDDLFRSPSEFAVDNQSRVYISDSGGIKVFDANGRYIEMIPIRGAHVFSIAFNDKKEMFIVAGNQVSKFAARGSDKQ